MENNWEQMFKEFYKDKPHGLDNYLAKDLMKWLEENYPTLPIVKRTIQKKINDICEKSDQSLKSLNEIAAKDGRYSNATGRLDVDESYAANIGVYAWAARSKRIACLEIQGILSRL